MTPWSSTKNVGILMIDMSMGFNLVTKEILRSKVNQIEYADD